jgi:hypothetical protein
MLDLLQVGWFRVQTMVEAKFFPPVQTHPGAHQASCAMGTVSFLEVRRLGLANDHSPPSNTKVKEYSYISTPPPCFYGRLEGELYLVLLYCNVINRSYEKKKNP